MSLDLFILTPIINLEGRELCNFPNRECIFAFSNHVITSPRRGNPGMTWIGWKRPPSSWMKLNTDGSVIGETGPAGAGGILRDALGNWVAGFTTYLDGCMIDEAESLALIHGLKMAWNLGARKIIVETDSLQAFKWVTGRQEVESSHGNVVSECQAWQKRDWTATINQIFREGNRAADEMRWQD